MTDRLVAFVTLLREHGITAGPSETIDAAEAIVALGTDNTDHLRSGLAATLLRRNGQRSVFDQLFDLYFLGRGGFGEVREPNSDAIETLRDELVTTLAADNPDATTELARRALTELGGYGSGGQGAGASGVVTTASGAGWSSYLTLKALRPDDLTERIASRMGSATSEFDTAVHTIEADRRLRAFRTALQTEARIRSADLRGTDYIARRGVEMSTDRIDFLGAREQDLAEMRRLVHPLARKLATRLAARRRKAVRGQIDLRRTLRASMSTGGVPVTPVLRARKHGRPDLVVLADLSGSVTGFAEFTLLLVAALQDQFSRVRSFGFIDTCAEITPWFTPGTPPTPDLTARIIRESGVTRFGSSNYGEALTGFVTNHLDALGPRTSLLILGDARTNRTDPNLAALSLMLDKAKHAYWLNPEPARSWNTGDSAAHLYAEHVTMHECRNVVQLAEVVGRLLPT
ncbi:vWA domain-containing protein [Nocardia cyriacigeorgica]|uniref:vWA domain-containing protein n=2 Tax=Nocardia cyriacigeorgica TaxID=135487 RepID=UPI00056036CA|nr:VWA domain-containing protein [Nocardia cyriacigeorgica]AVH25334.1 VWA domain-containing protein [Nocardia cyriacigeorgica]MBF6325722.1 VWA domain-containing protein [Nocardia cyriacigeorgica]MBF6498495.1 VWA domain-containing protein [Nocardia cyriacigeorgica]